MQKATQLDLFSSKEQNTLAEPPKQEEIKPVYPVEDGLKVELQRRINEVERQMQEEKAALSPEERQCKHEEEMQPRLFTGIMETHLKEGSLVRVNTAGVRYQIGYLKDVTRYGATFHPLDLQEYQKEKADLYIQIRNSYERLYAYEAERREAHTLHRENLKTHYDEFVMRYGNLNAKQNAGMILINTLLSHVETDKEGHKINRIKLDGLEATDEKRIGTRLQEIAKNATTGGLYTRIGEVYGFPIYVISETALKDGVSAIQNRFVVEGHYKYNYNNGQLAMADRKAAAMNFLNALERIPNIVEQYKAKNEIIEKDLPILQEVAGKTWKKEDELKSLKTELAALDRKIQLELVPPTPEKSQDGEVNSQTVTQREHLHTVRPKTTIESRGFKI